MFRSLGRIKVLNYVLLAVCIVFIVLYTMAIFSSGFSQRIFILQGGSLKKRLDCSNISHAWKRSSN